MSLETESQLERELEELRLDAFAFCNARDAMRLTLFRRYLQLTVRHVSPLLSDLVGETELLLALHQLRPGDDWPDSARGTLAADVPMMLRQMATAPASRRKRSRDSWFERCFKRMGAVLRLPSVPGGGLAVMVCGSHLGVCAVLHQAAFWACLGQLRITAFAEVPETVRCAAVGKPVGALIRHPSLDGRDYPIWRLRTAAGSLTAEAHTGCEPFAMPWPQLRYRP